MATTKVQKWGNSYAVRLPKATVDRLGLTSGKVLNIEENVGENGLMLTVQKKPLTLKEFVACINPKNRHPETDWGSQRGNEIW